MGPYCRFCQQRCFVHFPAGTPAKVLTAYTGFNIIATCKGGQEFERLNIGYCYDDIQDMLSTGQIADDQPELDPTPQQFEIGDEQYQAAPNIEAIIEADL